MANHGVLIPEAIYAKDVDAYVRSAVSTATAVDNGNIVKLTTRSAVANEGEVFLAVAPSTGDGLTGLWMVYSGDEIPVTDARYKGLDPDPRSFFTPISTSTERHVFSVYKPQLGDIILLTADAINGSYVASGSPTTHINATNTGGVELAWATSIGVGILSYKLLAVKYISLATGAIDDQRETAYEFECVVL